MTSPASANDASKIPDVITQEVKSKSGRELIVKPPAAHHLNVEGPSTAKLGKVALKRARASERQMAFTLPKNAKGQVDGIALICDDAGTFCVRKKFTAQVGDKGASRTPQSDSPIQVSVASTQSSSKKRKTGKFESGIHNGMIYNDAPKALALAKKSGKPLMIDFYGIWCPPCNVLDNTVFKSAEFKKVAKDWVLLKLDADAPPSWELKEKFKIGGYPTIILADSKAEEISRIVGSRKTPVFVSLMQDAYALRDKPVSSLAQAAEQGDSAAAYRLGLQALERAEFEQAEMWLERASKSWSEGDKKFEVYFEARIKNLKDQAKKKSDAKAGENVKKRAIALIEEALSKTKPGVFMFDQSLALASLHEELGNESGKKAANERAVATGLKILDDPSLKDPRAEYEMQDIAVITGDAQKELGQEAQAKASYARAAKIYEGLLAGLGKGQAEVERGWNLEYAWCLRQIGRESEAEKIYSKLTRKYPTEFTYHFAFARLKQDQGKLADAEKEAAASYENAYGDNRIRAGKLLAELIRAQGRNDEALDVIREVIAEAPVPSSDPFNRTHRYIEQVKKVEADWSKPVNTR